CLPLLMYAVFLIVKSLKNKEDISPKSLFWLGVTSGCILWIKYTMLGFYLGWCIVPMFFALKHKKWKYILNMFLYIGAGVLLITALVLSYFLLNGALYDLWDVYFYTNIFKYPANSTGLYNMFVGLVWLVFDVVVGNIGFSLLLTVGVVWAVVKHRFRLMAQVVLMLLFGAIVIY
ncbi:MAG: hypothetical protein Q4D17_10065, partial [Planctomycetia bacterium]|nr:hypothetical protein [Planctomycetia bacterium]